MRILLTGATGFIGDNFIRCNNKKYEISVLVRDSTKIKSTDVKVFEFDGSLESIVKSLDGVDIVIHLATYYVAEHESEDVYKLINSNVMFGSLLLEAMNILEIKKIINIGTTWQKFNSEDFRYANLYAATKQAFQEIISWYSDAKNFKVINLHLNDTYGEDDKRKKIIQLLIESAFLEKPLDMSLGEQQFETCYISDVIRAIDNCVQDLELSNEIKNETYSLLTGDYLTLKELVSEVESVINKKINVNWGEREYREREVMTCLLYTSDAADEARSVDVGG
ncbi:NAD-dependent epimerase/dehydratase family protein, partial [Photobacterium phosphoreum]|uniref:NAD-dependent epimerase/dehydratase family protein n=1 Tax=Photobacterium phosphoreum TaxID=659 RepID=UPI000D1773C8